MLLTELFPDLAKELEQLLSKKEQPDLAEQVRHLRIVDRCRCEDDFCASFFTQPKPRGSYGPGLRCVELDPAEGMLILDVVEGVIFHVEVLYRDDIRKKLHAAFP